MNQGFVMAGTEHTFEYIVVACTSRGRVGYRKLGNESYRVRVEPSNLTEANRLTLAEIFNRPTWKQVGDDYEFRFSTVVSSKEERDSALKLALDALGKEAREINPDLKPRILALVEGKESSTETTQRMVVTIEFRK